MSSEVFFAAHSLGAAEIWLAALRRRKLGLRVDGIYALASPLPGDKNVAVGLNGDVPTVVSVKNLADYVTDVPFDVSVAGLDYSQPVPFTAISEPPSPSDKDLFFRFHHIGLYAAGCRKLPDPGTAAIGLADAADQVARLYVDPTNWDWFHPVNGAYWAMKIMPSGAKLMIRRGSVTGTDWLLQDLDFTQIDMFGAKISRGFWSGVAPVADQMDAVLL